MSYRDHNLGELQLTGLTNCPHCSVSNPVVVKLWRSERPLPRADGGEASMWASYCCTTCGSMISAKGTEGHDVANPFVEEIFPDIWEVDEIVPARVSNYLSQAHRTMQSPDASVVMSAACIDAMLKDNNLADGSLYNRIDAAVEAGILTQNMADWAHRVRLDANNPRHADEAVPHMSIDDAQRAFDYANALTEYLYLLPSRMPPELTNE